MTFAGRAENRLSRQLLVVGVLAVVLPLAVVLTALQGLQQVHQAHVASAEHRQARQFQQDADMMHDAIHADVLELVLTRTGPSLSASADIHGDLRADTAQMRRDLDQMDRYPVSPAVARLRQQVESDLRVYLRQAEVIDTLASRSPKAAAARLPRFDRLFHRLVPTQADLTAALSAAAARTDARAAHEEVDARRWTLLIAATMWLVLLSLGYFVYRLVRNHGVLLNRLRTSRQEIATANAQLEAGQRVAHVGSWSWDPATGQSQRSQEVHRILGIPPDDLEPFSDLLQRCVHPEDRDRLLRDRTVALESADTFVSDYRIVRPDGSIREVESRAAVVRDASGHAVRLTGTIQDLTEQRQVQRMKDGFVALISHELRTPLTSIKGALGLLASGAVGSLPEKAQRMVEIADVSSDRLTRLINDVLDVDKLAAGGLALELGTHPAGELVDTAVAEMGAMARTAGVELVVTGSEGAVEADGDRVVQTLNNLLSNAVKFSPPGSTIEVGTRREGAMVVFAVADHGRGIPQDKLASVFDRFHQVEAADGKAKGGTGLGLAICKGIVEQHGGRIWVTSDPGRGSTFEFTLPAAGAAPIERGTASGDAGTVLVCDDDPAVLQVVATLLEEHGYNVLTANSGSSAVERAATDRPDVILMDLLMPGMSGTEAIGALRERSETAGIPVVVLSGLGREKRANLGLPATSLSGWLNKPPDIADLLAALAGALANTADRRPVADRPVSQTPEAAGPPAILDLDAAVLEGRALHDTLRGYGYAKVPVLVLGSDADRVEGQLVELVHELVELGRVEREQSRA